MRAHELIEDGAAPKAKKPRKSRAKPKPEPVPYNPGWESLNYLKEWAKRAGEQLAGTYQLFMPRPHPGVLTKYDKAKKNLANRYAWDDDGNLKEPYQKWEDNPLEEGAPLLKPGKAVAPPGRNKPNADLWTSTAYKTNKGYSSDWVKWTYYNQKGWMSPVGYLYKVKPGALVLEIDSDHDAEQVMAAFQKLERVKDFDWSDPDVARYGTRFQMQSTFPWDEVVKHFDAVRHRNIGYGSHDNGFMYGWDCESTGWLDTSFLQLVGEVPIYFNDDQDDL